MSLIHWWPLGENKNDIVGGAHLSGTYATSGKGKISAGCASEWGTRLSTSTSNLTGLKNFSIAMWVRLDSAANSNAWSDLFGMNMQKGSTTESLRAEVNSTGGNALQLYCNAISGTSGGAANFTLTKDTWQHLVITKNGARLTSYINGSIVNYTDWSNITDAYCTGEFHLSDGGFYCSYNDVRLYNHVLSTKEIKELSKALVLHYTFDNSSFENTTNLLSDRVTNFSDSPLGTYSGFSNQMGTGSLIEVRDFQNKRCLYFKGGSGSNDRCYIYKDVAGSTKYTFSCDIYSTSQITLRAEGNGGGYGSGWPEVGRVVYSTPGKWQRVSYTMNVADSPRLYLFFIVPNGVECYINNLQLEEKDHDTIYTPMTRTGIIGDSSGLGNNGQLVLPEYYSFTQDSILGTGALHSYGENNGRAYIDTILNPSFINGSGTICFWYKKDSGSTNFLVATPRQTSSGKYLWANQPGSTPWNNGASYSSWYIDGVEKKSVAEANTDWHFYCITGVDVSTWSTFTMHCYSDGSWLYRGKIADFRIYNTVLSTTDIKELYNVRWSANKQGQVFSNAINEGQSRFQIAKAGVNNCNQVYESGVVPSGYLVLDGIKMERVPWINTGVVFNNAHTQIMVAADITPTATSGNNCLAGCGNSNWTGPVMLNFCGGKLEFGTNGYSTSSEAQGAYAANERLVVHAVIDYNSQKWFKNGVQIKNITSRTCPTTTAPLYIGTFKTPSSSVGNDNSFRGYIHYFEVKYGSIHKKFIPCKRLEDSVLGMYEINEGIFYSPEGGIYTTGPQAISQSRDGSLYCAEFNEI